MIPLAHVRTLSMSLLICSCAFLYSVETKSTIFLRASEMTSFAFSTQPHHESSVCDFFFSASASFWASVRSLLDCLSTSLNLPSISRPTDLSFPSMSERWSPCSLRSSL